MLIIISVGFWGMFEYQKTGTVMAAILVIPTSGLAFRCLGLVCKLLLGLGVSS